MSHMGQIGDAVITPGELTFEWAVKDFFSLSEKPCDFYSSPRFSFADSQWQLRLYPNGPNDRSHGMSGLFLLREDSGPSRTVSYTFGIKVSNGMVETVGDKCEFSKKGVGHGTVAFLTRADLNDQKSVWMPDNILTISCNLRSDAVSIAKDPVSTDRAVQAVAVGERKLLKSLLSMLESGEDSDVVLKVGGEELPAHRNILRARSSVFHSMFAHEMVEKNSGVVHIEDCDPTTFTAFLVHIYSGRCDQISTKNACSLFTTADKYDVGELKEACSEFMKQNITVECFCNVLAVALKHDEEDLLDMATRFFCDHSVDVVKTVQWQTFLAENPTVGNELFLKAISK